ncbi:MAG: hypothetical protein NC334_09010 [Bacteroides sp.]|nr:hypothetical protein [Bacteroides sp.]
MKKEQNLYNKFVDTLIKKLDNEPTSKDLDVIRNFLKDNNIQASPTNKGLSGLNSKITPLPFDMDEDELPLKRVK